MAKTLAEQIQEVIDVLLLAQSHALTAKETMRQTRITLPLEYSYFEDDIAKMVSRLRLMRTMADRQGW